MTQQKTQTPFRSYSVRPDDFVAAMDEAKRVNVRKADFLGVLLRGWSKLTARQRLECIPEATSTPSPVPAGESVPQSVTG